MTKEITKLQTRETASIPLSSDMKLKDKEWYELSSPITSYYAKFEGGALHNDYWVTMINKSRGSIHSRLLSDLLLGEYSIKPLKKAFQMTLEVTP